MQQDRIGGSAANGIGGELTTGEAYSIVTEAMQQAVDGLPDGSLRDDFAEWAALLRMRAAVLSPDPESRRRDHLKLVYSSELETTMRGS